MKFRITADDLSGALSTARQFTFKPGSNGPEALQSVLLTADKDSKSVRFVANSPSQALTFSIPVDEVKEEGEVLAPAASLATALAALRDGKATITVTSNNVALSVESKRSSAQISVIDLRGESKMRPQEPAADEGRAFRLTVPADEFADAYKRVSRVTANSSMPNVLVTTRTVTREGKASDELVFAGLNPRISLIASVPIQGKAKGEFSGFHIPTLAMDSLASLAKGAKTVTIASDDIDITMSATFVVEAEDSVFVVNQRVESDIASYTKAYDRIAMAAETTLASKPSPLIQTKVVDLRESIESSVSIHEVASSLTKSDSQSQIVPVGDGAIEVRLRDGGYRTEIDAKLLDGADTGGIEFPSLDGIAALASLPGGGEVRLYFDVTATDKAAPCLIASSDTTVDDEGRPGGFFGVLAVRAAK